MKRIYIACLVLFLSCSREKTLFLPETKYSEIYTIDDISPAYLFYNEKLQDSIELNRSSLISTTNWLVSVDKRLALKQAIPKIVFLQEKKRNMKMHKNENAKNYYTCNNIQVKNLGFIEFTNIVYHFESSFDYIKKISHLPKNPIVHLRFESSDKIEIIGFSKDFVDMNSNKDSLKIKIENLIKDESNTITFELNFNKNLTFQDYISFESFVRELKSNQISIDPNEFIY